jgi:hypothetical protein
MKVDGNYVIDAGDMEEICYHASCDSSAMLLLLRLARVGEIRHDSFAQSVGGGTETDKRSWYL